MSGPHSKTDLSADVLIVGGGVIGLAIARELAHRGVHQVALIERRDLGQEASWAAGGILGPQVEANCADDFLALACASRDLYPTFVESLEEETGIDVELDRTGTLYLGFNERDEAALRNRYEWQSSNGLRVDWLTGDEARRLEPVISPDARCALHFPDDWQVDNRKLIESLIQANRRLGVHLVSGCEVKSIRVEHNRVNGIESANGFIGARTVVIAAGAWTSNIATSGTNFTPAQIEPVRGQMLCFKTHPRLASHLIYSSRGYLVPRLDGRVLAGSTSERVGFEKSVTGEGVAAIRSLAFEMAPSLAAAPIVDSWSGLRPRAVDDLPVLGPAEGVPGLFYATGHYRNGILLAPITARAIAGQIVEGSTSTPIERFSPGRFCAATV
jgi:glycine oxidase